MNAKMETIHEYKFQILRGIEWTFKANLATLKVVEMKVWHWNPQNLIGLLYVTTKLLDTIQIHNYEKWK